MKCEPISEHATVLEELSKNAIRVKKIGEKRVPGGIKMIYLVEHEKGVVIVTVLHLCD